MVQLSIWITGAAVAAATLGYVSVLLAYRANWITRGAQVLTITVDGEERDIYIQPTNASGDVEVYEEDKNVV